VRLQHRSQKSDALPADATLPVPGDSRRGPHITPGAVLVFQLEILKVKGPGQPQAESVAADNVSEAAHEL
jgi:hypothetical protein